LTASLSNSRVVQATRWLALLTFLFFLATAFRGGWKQLNTDFPNYYTAAVLVRQGQPLHNYYDWTWFERQMNYAGAGLQLGAYTPQTPLTMLPLVGLTGLAPLRAKQVWLVCNLGFLVMTVWLLSRMTRFRVEQIWLLTFCGYFSLRTNFLYGQYYVFLLLLLTLAFYGLHRGNPALSGVLAGIAFGLKLYGGPFLLYFLAKRKWKAVLGMIAAMACLGVVAIAMFGWNDIVYYATQILPRSLEGGSINPYAPGVPTYSTMLRHFFVREPELNPRPLLESPWTFFFLRTFVSVTVVAFLTLGVALKPSTDRRDFAWFVVAVVLLSTSTASYTFIILLLPLVLLLEESTPLQRAFFVVSYVLLTAPLGFVWLFPKVWLQIGIFVVLGWERWRSFPRGLLVGSAVLITLIAVVDARQHMRAYAEEPGQHFERVAMEEGAMFSSYPAVSRAGLFYQSMGNDRYVLRWLHDDHTEELTFAGQAFHPVATTPDGPLFFELVANRKSTMMQFDPTTRKTTEQLATVLVDNLQPVVSPDGRWAAFTSTSNGPEQIWLRNLADGRETRLTGGNCNSSSPAWALDSKYILFASDCNRAFGLPALYRAPVP
jgi:Glycosyltransferase family 87/WD40-like Beta Propeller Repeat